MKTQIDSILDYYTKSYNQHEMTITTSKKNPNELIFLKCLCKTSQSKVKKRNLERKYALLIDEENYVKEFRKDNDKSKKCCNCDSMDLSYLSNGIYYCENCEYSVMFFMDDEKYNEDNETTLNQFITNNNHYQKIKYYESYLDRLQIKKVPDIESSTLSKIRDLHINVEITPLSIKKTLIIMNMPKLCHHISYIHNKLCPDVGPPHITNDHIEYMKGMFTKIESIWPEIKEMANRKSFPSYPYCSYKILELLEDYDQCLNYFKTGTSQKYLENLDRIWILICKRLNWEFIPTYLS